MIPLGAATAASLLAMIGLTAPAWTDLNAEPPHPGRAVSHGYDGSVDCRPGIGHVADRLMTFTGPGFVGLRTDEEFCEIHAEWNVQPPAAFTRYAERSPRGVTVTSSVDPESIDRVSVSAALRAIEAAPVFDEVELVARALTPDGVELTIAKGSEVTEDQRQRIRRAADGVPVRILRARADGPLLS